jgi:nucleotide-binding universal stress UspA family protein
MKAKTILVPTDFSEHSDHALRQALETAKAEKGKILLVHVVHEEIIQCADTYCLEEAKVEELKEDIKKSAAKSLGQQIDRFKEFQDVEIEPVVRTGTPYEEILKLQKDRQVDMIVIAALGRKGLKKFLLGGVARNVLKGAECPVLLVK